MSKHVTDFMCKDFDHSLKDPAFKLFTYHFFFSPLRHQSMNTLNSTILWTGNAESVVSTPLSVQIHICQSNDSDRILDASLDWTNDFL
jgi:hypothetical protein